MVKWLNKQELEKSDWVDGRQEGIEQFRGNMQGYLTTIGADIRDILINDSNIKVKKFIGDKIKQFIDFLKNDETLKRFIIESPKIPDQLFLLNKVRTFAAHGIGYTNFNQFVLIKDDIEKIEGLIFDNDLIEEMKNLFNECDTFILNVQTQLGHLDTENEEHRYFID